MALEVLSSPRLNPIGHLHYDVYERGFPLLMAMANEQGKLASTPMETDSENYENYLNFSY